MADFDLGKVIATETIAQDPYPVSRRVWAGVLALLAGITADPGVQQALLALLPALIPTPYLPVVSAVLSALLAWRSKAVDPRPVRGQ